MYQYQDIINEYRFVGDDGDPWGSSMDLFFEVAGEMWERGLDIPVEWNYRAGLSTKDEESYWFKLTKGLNDADLTRLGKFLHRYVGLLVRHGKDY